MKVRVTNDAYYNKRRIKEGDVIDFLGDKLPSWAKAIKVQETSVNPAVPVVPSMPPEKQLGGTAIANKYSELSWQDLQKLAKERNVKATKRVDIENELIAQDIQPSKTQQDTELESMTVQEIADKALKELGCKLDINQTQEMMIESYKNAVKTFGKSN